MSAQTINSVDLTDEDWTLLTSADTQYMQVIFGKAGVIWADTKPDASIEVKDKGHVYEAREPITNYKGGTAWGRAQSYNGKARIGITEA